MKSLKLFLFAAAAFCLFAGSAFAQLIAYDDAAQYYKTANWTNNANQGFGYTPWQFFTSGSNNHGNYIGNGWTMGQTTNVAGTNYTNIAWGLFANGASNINQSIAYRGFSNSLGTNTFKLQWAAKGAGNTAVAGQGTVHGFCGFYLRNGNSTNFSTDILNNLDPSTRFLIYFLDGASPSTLYVFDGSAGSPISLTGTSFSTLGRGLQGTPLQIGTNAAEVEVTVGPDGNSYHMVLKDIIQNKTLYVLDSTLYGSGTIDSVALFDRETSGGGGTGVSVNGDQNYNRMQIAPPNLVPPTIVNVEPTNGTIYMDPTETNITFEVDSFNSTVASNFVTVLLNGVSQTNLTYNTTSPTTALLATCGAKIAPDTFYNLVIIAQDANGNFATNTSTFNTFLASDLYIDAADYNYTNGLFINNSTPTDAYQNFLGVQGVDYFILDTAGTNNTAGYRSGDLPEILPLPTDVTGDPIDHANLRLNGGTAYNIGFTDTGNWENYTRVIPIATNYSIYARASSATGGQFEVQKLVNATATTSNEPLATLGTITVPNTGGSKVFSGQLTPVTDIFGNTAVLNLTGTVTLRQTALASKVYNLEYLLVVEVTNATSTLRPYFSVASPAPNATGVLLDSPLSFTIVNRQTTLNSGSLQVFVNNTNITTSGVISNNAVGSTFTYVPTFYYPVNSTNTVKVIFADSGSVSQTNSWQFVTVNASNTIIPAAYAQPFNAGTTRGFGITTFKISDSAPVVGSISNAWNELAGLLIDTNSGTPYLNLATNASGGNFYLETNTITYDFTGATTGSFTFTNRSAFPNFPATTNTANNYVFQALTYLQLASGSYHVVVRSDDGFDLATGPTLATATNLDLGRFDVGRANTTPTDIYFTVTTNGLYPMSLLYVQEQFTGNIEFYSVANGVPILINDPANPNSIKAFESLSSPAIPVTLLHPAYTNGTASFSFLTQSGHTNFVQYNINLANTNGWTPLLTVPGTGSTTNITDNTGGNIRFYRVLTQ